MINKSTAEPLVSYGGNLGKIVRVPGNGTAVRWNLWKGQSDPEGELRISSSDNRLYLPESDPRKLGRLRSKLLVAESSRQS